jgi:hypothetical protein
MEIPMIKKYPKVEVDNYCKASLDIKRCYLPISVTDICSECNEVRTISLDDHYLSYPVIGMAEPVSFYCDSCHHEWDVDIVINLNVELAEKIKDE